MHSGKDLNNSRRWCHTPYVKRVCQNQQKLHLPHSQFKKSSQLLIIIMDPYVFLCLSAITQVTRLSKKHNLHTQFIH